MRKIKQDVKHASSLKASGAILGLIFLGSIGLAVWSINLYRLTIIDSKYLFAAVVSGAFIVFACLLFLYKSPYSIFWTFFISIVIGGGVFCFGILYLNHAFAEKETLTDELPIIKTGNLARGLRSNCSQPYATVDFFGIEKQLLFYCEYEKTIKKYSKVVVAYSRGLLGFDVIRSKELVQ